MVDTIAELASLSKKLNQKSDTLNATIESINDKLEPLNFGIAVVLDKPIEHDGAEYSLGYHKLASMGPANVAMPTMREKWQLSIQNGRSGHTGPLLRAPREVRIQALDDIPSLLDLMKQRAEELIESIESAEKLAENL
jgi:hypothetical protein